MKPIIMEKGSAAKILTSTSSFPRNGISIGTLDKAMSDHADTNAMMTPTLAPDLNSAPAIGNET